MEISGQMERGKREETEEHLDYEVHGIHDILKNCSSFQVRMGGVYIDDKLEAFTIGSYNSFEDMAVIHIEKANPEIRGLYQYINQQFLVHEFPEVHLINREDDLGIEGLRKAKMSYNPLDFARKYEIRQIHFPGRIRSWKGADKMLHYLNKEEKNRSRELWEQAFPEDSDCFQVLLLYKKPRDNRLLVRKRGTDSVHAASQSLSAPDGRKNGGLRLYCRRGNGQKQQKKGLYEAAYGKGAEGYEEEGMPFCFLMPALKPCICLLILTDIYRKSRAGSCNRRNSPIAA